MKDLIIVYGSESNILQELYKRKNTFFIKIFNKKKPENNNNSMCINNFCGFKKIFTDLIKKRNFKKIIFLGVAFKSQNNLFILENDNQIEEMVNVNILNYLKYSKFLLPFMLNKKNGNFIYLSSFRSNTTSKGTSLYSSSKAFGERFFEIIGKEYGSKGIFSCIIRLGYFEGKMIENIDKKIVNDVIKNISNKRLGTSKELVETIEFVIKNEYTNSSVIELNGGINFI